MKAVILSAHGDMNQLSYDDDKHKPGRGIRVAVMMAEPDASRLYELADEVARGGLILPTAKTFPLSQIQQATKLAEKGGGGKIILTIA